MTLWGGDLAALLPFITVGLVAQMIDGALGMAFGVISNTLLVSMGVPPAAASAGVHTIKIFTGAASGLSHVIHGNIDYPILLRLAAAGIVGGVIGAYAISHIDADIARPIVAAYLTAIGVSLVARAIHSAPKERKPKGIEPLAVVGGFLDASGGGGWGPIVTSNLLIQGGTPRMMVGTVNAAEFFLAIAISISFVAAIGFEAFTTATLGLLIGGVIAAPFGAYLAKHVRPRPLMMAVGLLLTVTSGYGLYRALV